MEELERYKPAVLQLAGAITDLSDQQKSIAAQANYINLLPNCNLLGKAYKIAPYSDIRPTTYQHFFTVRKANMTDLFPVLETISDESVFQRLKFKLDEYCFVFDPAPLYERISSMIREAGEKLQEVTASQQIIEDTLLELTT